MELRVWACIRSCTSLVSFDVLSFLLLLFSFWENSRRGTLKIVSRKKNVNKTKKGKIEFPGKTVNSQEA